MKVVFFTENGYAGGLDTFTTNLINYWPRVEDELVLICNKSHPGLAGVTANLTRPCRVIAHDIPLLWNFLRHLTWLPAVVRRPLSPILKYVFLLSYIPQIARLLGSLSPDRLVVVNGGYPGGDTCRAATIAWGLFFRPTGAVHNFHNLSFPPRWWERPIENFIDRLVDRSTEKFIAPSLACGETLRLRATFANSPKISFIHNGTEDPPIHADTRGQIRSSLRIENDEPMVVMLGTYEPRKGHSFLLDSFSRVVRAIPAAKLVIAGYGSDDEIAVVRKLVGEFGLTDAVRIESFRLDRHMLLNETDVLVVSSQAFESFGLTLIEAMSHSVPVVTTRVGGTGEVIGEDGAVGYCVDPQDAELFADRIISLLADEKLRHRLGAVGYVRFRKYFTAQRMASDYAELLHRDALSPPRAVASDR